MSDGNWNPWKISAIGMALVIATALVTGVVVAKWGGSSDTAEVSSSASPRTAQLSSPPPRSEPATAPAPRVPSQTIVDACNQWAANEVGQKDKTMEVVKDGAIGAVLGAAVGAAGGAIAGGGKGAGKGAAIGGVAGAGGGALYGLNENRKQDEKYRVAYSSCLRSRGFAS